MYWRTANYSGCYGTNTATATPNTAVLLSTRGCWEGHLDAGHLQQTRVLCYLYSACLNPSTIFTLVFFHIGCCCSWYVQQLHPLIHIQWYLYSYTDCCCSSWYLRMVHLSVFLPFRTYTTVTARDRSMLQQVVSSSSASFRAPALSCLHCYNC